MLNTPSNNFGDLKNLENFGKLNSENAIRKRPSNNPYRASWMELGQQNQVLLASVSFC